MKKNNTNTKTLLAILFGMFALIGNTFAAEKVVASGSWTKKEHSIAGTWKIIDYGSKVRIKFFGLKTKKAPDLKVFLHPKGISEVTAKNALSGSKFISKLTSHKGYQEYDLPAGVKWQNYKSILIHCEKYTKLWGGANLK